MGRRWLETADRGLARLILLGRWLVLPVSLLLFAQWPLRDLVHAYSSSANDLAQWLFALYVSLAMTYATRERSHLAADTVARHYSIPARNLIARAGALCCVLPWSLFFLVASWPMVMQSVRQLEEFPETYNPGYFLIKVSAWLLALLALLQALLDVARPAPPR
ncbi:MAG TPA: TRAP transporter small permease subunit [Candidatus Dormibacteraeota bacterium]|nr:TRAP transporter small permease subunit [Candidatus Dormibacteraeota bacterium]